MQSYLSLAAGLHYASLALYRARTSVGGMNEPYGRTGMWSSSHTLIPQ